MANDSEAPMLVEMHATTEAPGAVFPAAATAFSETETKVTTTSATATTVPAPPLALDRDEALARTRRSSAPSPEESQLEAIEQHHANLSRDSLRSPFGVSRPHHNASLEYASVDLDVGWQGPEPDSSRILRRRARTTNDLCFITSDEPEPDKDGGMSSKVKVTTEGKWALE
jgi:hypothetical protein